jgi:hypothetical protein
LAKEEAPVMANIYKGKKIEEGKEKMLVLGGVKN